MFLLDARWLTSNALVTSFRHLLQHLSFDSASERHQAEFKAQNQE
jgi:hypothetical protein